MSGLVALLHTGGGDVDPGALQAMASAIGHRGPDGQASLTEGSLGLAHLLLRSTPEAARERQPLRRMDLCLVADCRIDNRAELLALLGVDAAAADAELILAAYARWGEACVSHLRGDFAYALWDARRQRLFVARDHFGVKPLYWFRGRSIFAAASEPRALLALDGVPRAADELTIAAHLTGNLGDATGTYWRHISRLPAAHAMTVEPDGRTALRRYWSLDPERELRLRNDDEYAERLRELFVGAVERRVRSRGAVGAALSGGLDSTAVASVAQSLGRDRGRPPVHTFSLVFDRLPEVDERRWIEPALARWRPVSHVVDGDALDPLALMDELVEQAGGPFYAPNLFLHHGMYVQARSAGVHVFLDGLDGDTTLSHGHAYVRELALRGRLVQALGAVQSAAQRQGQPPALQAFKMLGVFPAYAAAMTALQRARGRLRHRDRRPNHPWDPFGVIDLAFAHRIDFARRRRSLPRHTLRTLSRERYEHHRRLSWPLLTLTLEALDWAAAAQRIEPRYPFCDVELAEFCLAMPGDQKLRDGWTRWVFRRAMEGILPPEVQWRAGKSNLGPVLTTAMHAGGRQRVDALLRDPDTVAPYVDVAALRQRSREFFAAPDPYRVMSLWLPLVLDRGLRAAMAGSLS